MKQPTTVIRGNWPGKPQPKEKKMKVIKENYAPPDKQIYSRGKSQYSAYIEHLMSGKPGTLAIECEDMKTAKSLGHAIARYLQGRNKYDALRPRLRKDREDCVKVWVVPVGDFK